MNTDGSAESVAVGDNPDDDPNPATTEGCDVEMDGQETVRSQVSEALLGNQTAAGRDEYLRLIESVILHANDAIVITEAEPISEPGPRILYVNTAFTRWTGYTVEEVIGQTPRILQGPKTDPATLRQIRTALEQWQPIMVELLNYRKDGSEFWVELSIFPVADATGWYTHWISIQRDVTERKQAELLLRQQTQRMQLLADVTLKIRQSLQLETILETTVQEVRQLLKADRVLIHHLQPDGTSQVVTESVDPGLPRIAGQVLPAVAIPQEYQSLYTQGQVRAIADIRTEQAPSPLLRFLQQFGVKARVVVPLMQRGTLWGLLAVHQCYQPRQWLEGELELLQELANQVSIALTQSQLLSAVQESEGRFRAMADSAPTLMWIASPDTLRTFFNQTWLSFTGRTLAQEVGNGWVELVHPSDLQRCLRSYLSAFRQHQSFQLEYRMKRADGHYRWMIDRGMPRFQADGTFAGYVGSCVDISERKEAEANLLRTLAQEKELNELKSRFVSMTSHEFRTPLSSILSASELLEYYGHLWSDEEKHEQLKIIQNSVHHMTKLLEDVLLISQAEAGKLHHHHALLNLQQFCQDIIAQTQRLASQQHQLKLSVDCAATDLYLDAKLLRQILTNLLSNAVKYSPEGGTVRLHVWGDESNLTFCVTDEGIGIPAADQTHLFEAFHRASNVGAIAGTGLGLAIVQHCVQALGGRIMVTSEEGKGTEFRIVLPCHQSPT